MNAVSDLGERHVALARITDALFCSGLETGELPAKRQLVVAIRRALKSRRDWNGCTRAVAAAFANAPEDAERRERWCSQLAEELLSAADIWVDVDLLS